MSQNGTLSKNQERAIVALLTHATIAEAASATGVSERTVKRWLAEDDAFVCEYRAARRQVVEASIGNLQNATTEAVECLRRNLTCGTPATEVRSATAILEHSVKAIELYDLDERLRRVEEAYELGG